MDELYDTYQLQTVCLYLVYLKVSEVLYCKELSISAQQSGKNTSQP